MNKKDNRSHSVNVKQNGFIYQKEGIGMTPFTEEVIKIIRSIPEGKVMTYGQIARFAGSTRAARQVVRILHSMSKKYSLPWYRVVNAKGQIVIKNEEGYLEQNLNLVSEGVEVDKNGKIDLEKYQWFPAMDMNEKK